MKNRDGTLKKKFFSLHSVRNLMYTDKEMLLRDEYALSTWEVLQIYHTVPYRAGSPPLHKQLFYFVL